jgi:hypothetical protein
MRKARDGNRTRDLLLGKGFRNLYRIFKSVQNRINTGKLFSPISIAYHSFISKVISKAFSSDAMAPPIHDAADPRRRNHEQAGGNQQKLRPVFYAKIRT